jgi:hypothetical protein
MLFVALKRAYCISVGLITRIQSKQKTATLLDDDVQAAAARGVFQIFDANCRPHYLVTDALRAGGTSPGPSPAKRDRLGR